MTARLAAVLGDPIEQSLSPALHLAAAAAAGVDLTYLALRVAAADAAPALAGVRALGFAGVNLTMPLKDAGAAVPTRRSDEVTATAAANTLVVEGGELVAYNTDVDGFARAARDGLGLSSFSGMSTVVLGAGGAARAVAHAIGRDGAQRVAVIARRRGPAERCARVAGKAGRPVPLRTEAALRNIEKADLLVNATPIGMEGYDNDLPEALLAAIPASSRVMDLVYSPAMTPVLRAAAAAGAAFCGGLGMLVHQAALAFTLFTGAEAPLEAMFAAVEPPSEDAPEDSP